MSKYLCILLLLISFVWAEEECTIGVAAGRATPDGRPLLWKTRDTSDKDNEVIYNDANDYPYIAVVNAGKTYTWMGVNESGLAILNANSTDLPSGSSGYDNGSIMRYALGNCGTVADFEALLDETNSSGRATHGNFALIDAGGAAVIYEVSGSAYWKYDANDSTQVPRGYVLRTNFAENGDGVNGSGYERYNRTVDLIGGFHRGDSLTQRSILRHQMRDFSDFESNPVPVPFADTWIEGRPFGYIYSYVSICRSTSVSAVVMQGVKENESPLLTTMWTMLGHPAAALTVPYWPVGETPAEADGDDTAPLCDASNLFRSLLFDYQPNINYIDSYKLRDGSGGGLWPMLFIAEDSILTATEAYLSDWRADSTVNVTEMLAVENDYAAFAHQELLNMYNAMTTSVPANPTPAVATDFYLAQNYPNPFNGQTAVRFYMPQAGQVTIRLFSAEGRQVREWAPQSYAKGSHVWNLDALGLSSGIYFYHFIYQTNARARQAARKMVLIK